MGWRDRLREASFRSVPFQVDVTELQGGRRTVTHEYPAKSVPFVEDLGVATRTHDLDAYVVGETFLQDRDRLLDALEREGSGTLVHPYLGTLEVVCTAVRLRHSTAEGRLARLALTFVETAAQLQPETFVNPRAQVAASSEALEGAAGVTFDANVRVEAVPDWVSGTFSTETERLLAMMREVDLTGGGLQAVAEFTEIVDGIGSVAVELARLGGFPQRLKDAFVALEDAVASKLDALQVYLDLDAFRGTNVGYLSETGRDADRNAAALERLARELALAGAVRVASTVAWASHEDAVAARDNLALRLDELSEEAPDTTYQELRDLAAKLVQAVPPPDQALPHLEVVTPNAGTSTVLLAWRVYQDIGREAEIVARNLPPFPGFLRQGEPLELLVDPV